jgi:ribosomal protein L16 Arg81 hydroxylase
MDSENLSSNKFVGEYSQQLHVSLDGLVSSFYLQTYHYQQPLLIKKKMQTIEDQYITDDSQCNLWIQIISVKYGFHV